MKNPSHRDNRNGVSEKPITPLHDNSIILLREYFVLPDTRLGRSNVTEVWRNPIQEYMPRTKRSRSRIRRNTSSALRSTSRKSPTLRGISTEARRRSNQ